MELRHSLLILILLAAALTFNVHADDEVPNDAPIDMSPDDLTPPKDDVQLPPPQLSETPAPIEEGKNVKVDAAAESAQVVAARKHIEQIEAERAQLIKQNKELAEQRVLAEQELAKVQAQEKSAVEQLDQETETFKANKEKQDAYLANLKERFKAAQARLAQAQANRVEAERAQSKQAAVAKAAQAEVTQAEARLASPRAVSSVTEPNILFKHTCRVFASTQKGALVLEQKKNGDTISKKSEGPNWIGFKTSAGADGFVSKNCFN